MSVELAPDAVRLKSGIVAGGETILLGVSMEHEWIFDVLKDLSSYARANGLPALASKAEETLRVAEVEIMAPGQHTLREIAAMAAKGKAH